jgi:hypothetical protein
MEMTMAKEYKEYECPTCGTRGFKGKISAEFDAFGIIIESGDGPLDDEVFCKNEKCLYYNDATDIREFEVIVIWR